jgi:uncharacterized protein with PIN domain
MKFICDAMLGKLAKYLRILGLNTLYIRNTAMLEIFKDQSEPALFLTRNKRTGWAGATVLVTCDKPMDQLREIKAAILPHVAGDRMMGRCIGCNTELVKIDKGDIEQFVPEFVFHAYETFKRCPSCKKVYWQGSHAANMAKYVEEIVGPEKHGKNE